MQQRVLITKEIPQAYRSIFEDKGISVDIPFPKGMSQSQIIEKIDRYDAIITMLVDQVDEKVLGHTSKLKIVANYAVGFNNICLESAKKKGIVVTNTPDILTEATAEMALTLILACSRRLKEAQSYIRANKWKSWETMELLGPALKGKTLGIFGMGRIGECLAKKCELALGMKVIYCNRHKKDTAYKHVNFEELLLSSDVLSVHAPLTTETKNAFDLNCFKKMKKSAIFINTARGEMCHTQELYQALKDKVIFAAGLDVTDPEPLETTHPIYQLDNAIITPHIGSATIEARNEMAKLCAENIVSVLSGNAPLTPL